MIPVRKKPTTNEEIEKQTREFAKLWLPDWRKYCAICGACNCKNNESCIKCNIQF